MYLTRYSLINGLCSGDREVSWKLSRFRLISIVLHDPDDSRFKERMQARYSDLRRETGQDMIFMTFMRGLQPEFRQSPQIEALYNDPHFNDKELLDGFIRAVAPDVELPAIVLAESLTSNRYIILESSADEFDRQLIELGMYCSSLGRQSLMSPTEQPFLESLGRYRCVEKDRSLAEELTDMLALTELQSNSAREWAYRRLEELEQDMDVRSATGENAQDATIAYYSYKSAVESGIRRVDRPVKDRLKRRTPQEGPEDGALITDDGDMPLFSVSSGNESAYNIEPRSIRPISDTPTFYQTYKIDTRRMRGLEMCERLSRNAIEQYNRLLPRFLGSITRPTDDEAYFADGRQSGPRSFSPLISYLNDFIDRELNLTIVQQMRRCLGIPMPEYYRQFCPTGRAEVKTGRDHVVDLNEYRQGRLQPLSIGDAFYAYKEMCTGRCAHKIPYPLGSGFMDNWYVLMRVRNRGFHAQYEEEDMVDFYRFREYIEAFKNLTMNYLSAMQEIKCMLKGVVS